MKNTPAAGRESGEVLIPIKSGSRCLSVVKRIAAKHCFGQLHSAGAEEFYRVHLGLLKRSDKHSVRGGDHGGFFLNFEGKKCIL